jgi:hypothetical protein
MRWPTFSDLSSPWTRELHIDLRPLGRLARDHPQAVIVGLGIALRVITYLWNRAMWLDEMSLRGNVVDRPILDFSSALSQDQLAPLGFLIVVRAMAAVLGDRNYVLRFLPLAAGLVALLLFRRLAPRILPRRAALVALVLFALSDDLIYYSSEFKPYSLDLAFGLGLTLLTSFGLGRTPSTRVIVWMSLLLAASPWFSFASAFVVAGCGMVLLLDAAAAGRHRTAVLWLAMGAGWLANFAIAYEASHALLVPETTMYRFWDFAFLPLTVPPTRAGLLKSAGLLLEVFVNPLNLLAPGGSPLGVVLPLSLLIAGSLSMARHAPRNVLLLAAPIAMALAASISRRFPFHGRLLLELVPALYLLIAQGTEWVARRFPSPSEIAHSTILLVLLAYPCWDACYQSSGRRNRDFNIHGDLHRNVFIDLPAARASGTDSHSFHVRDGDIQQWIGVSWEHRAGVSAASPGDETQRERRNGFLDRRAGW